MVPDEARSTTTVALRNSRRGHETTDGSRVLRKLILQRFKQGLTLLGERMPDRVLLNTQITVNYMMLGNWMRANRFEDGVRVADREALFDLLAEKVGDVKTLYLEFGVYQGRSMRYWSEALRHEEAVLHGFDSFEGLPEDFDRRFGLTKHALDVGGAIPSIEDPRVTFFKGWFEDVLPSYEVPDHDQLVITF